ncbi:MAG TPA: hypothetical protein VEW26_09880 [Allosphingosinicella sp.]|nr:hypothetical protein [Allosphingosinicella sp.]
MRLWTLAGAAAAALASAPGGAQIAPGVRAPESVAAAAADAWLLGCFFAASERPAAGLNIGFETAGPGLHSVTSLPDGALMPLIRTLPDRTRIAVLDAPGGQVWMFHDPKSKRCIVVPTPVSTEGVEAGFLKFMTGSWKPVEGHASAPPGARVFEDSFGAALGRPAVTLRTWYQPASGADQPQMIVTEQVRRKKK